MKNKKGLLPLSRSRSHEPKKLLFLRFSWLVVNVVVLSTAPTASGAGLPLSADRPGTATAPDIFKPGQIQLEGGFKFERQTEGTPNTDTYTIPEFLVRLGAVSSIELRISADGYIYKDRDGKRNVDNGSDLSIEGKMRWFSQSGSCPPAVRSWK